MVVTAADDHDEDWHGYVGAYELHLRRASSPKGYDPFDECDCRVQLFPRSTTEDSSWVGRTVVVIERDYQELCGELGGRRLYRARTSRHQLRCEEVRRRRGADLGLLPEAAAPPAVPSVAQPGA